MLVIEDDVAIRESIAEVLALEGYIGVGARDGREGYPAARDYEWGKGSSRMTATAASTLAFTIAVTSGARLTPSGYPRS